jgi:hypothetical protein
MWRKPTFHPRRPHRAPYHALPAADTATHAHMRTFTCTMSQVLFDSRAEHMAACAMDESPLPACLLAPTPFPMPLPRAHLLPLARAHCLS